MSKDSKLTCQDCSKRESILECVADRSSGGRRQVCGSCFSEKYTEGDRLCAVMTIDYVKEHNRKYLH